VGWLMKYGDAIGKPAGPDQPRRGGISQHRVQPDEKVVSQNSSSEP